MTGLSGRSHAPPLIALAAVATAVMLVPTVARDGVDTLAVLDVLVAASFTVSGGIAVTRRPDSSVGTLMLWFALVWAGTYLAYESSSPLILTIGGFLQNLWYAIFAAILLAFSAGRLTTRTEWAIVGVIAVAGVPLEVVRRLFLDDAGNALLVWPSEVTADAVSTVQRVLFIAAVAALLAVLVKRWLDATERGRRTLLPALAGTPLFMIAAAIVVQGAVPEALLKPLLLTFMAAPVALLFSMLQARLARSAVAGLLVELRGQPSPATVRDAVARSLRDPSLTVAYWLPEFESYADADGAPVDVSPHEGRTMTRVDSNGTPVAALLHDSAVCDEPELLGAVATAAAITLENARLHVDLRARLEELRASRARIVEAGDYERRRIERDLHDGAQQRMVAIALQLRLLQRRIRSDPVAAEQLAAAACDEMGESLRELRELARGIHPAVLEHGLDAALGALATRSPVPTTVAVELSERLPERVELAAYFVASEALANVAKYACATSVTVRAWRTGPAVLIEIADDGVGSADEALGSGLRGLADRIEALEGRLRVRSPEGGGTVVTAEMPT